MRAKRLHAPQLRELLVHLAVHAHAHGAPGKRSARGAFRSRRLRVVRSRRRRLRAVARRVPAARGDGALRFVCLCAARRRRFRLIEREAARVRGRLREPLGHPPARIPPERFLAGFLLRTRARGGRTVPVPAASRAPPALPASPLCLSRRLTSRISGESPRLSSSSFTWTSFPERRSRTTAAFCFSRRRRRLARRSTRPPPPRPRCTRAPCPGPSGGTRCSGYRGTRGRRRRRESSASPVPPGTPDGDPAARRVPARRDPDPASSDPASSSSSASISGFVATICETSSEPLDGSVGEALRRPCADRTPPRPASKALPSDASRSTRASATTGQGAQRARLPRGRRTRRPKTSPRAHRRACHRATSSSISSLERAPGAFPPRASRGSRQRSPDLLNKSARHAFSNRPRRNARPDRAAFPGRRDRSFDASALVERASARVPRTELGDEARSWVCRARLAQGWVAIH